MTRINCVPVVQLTNAHLMAEYRELPRVFRQVRAAVERGERPNDRRNPTEYRLGTGHVRFFYPRLEWLAGRHAQLTAELLKRGYKLTVYERTLHEEFADIPPEWWRDWAPTAKAMLINWERIHERLEQRAA